MLIYTFIVFDFTSHSRVYLAENILVQCIIKKDRSDANNPARTTDFHEKLITAYKDPALKPVQFSGRTNGHNAPLLATEA